MKVRLDNISYKLHDKPIIDNISISIPDGEVLAILGDNGSGKSTIIEIISGLLKPSNGSVSFGNGEKSFNKNETGILWDNISLFPWLKVKEVLAYLGSIYRLPSSSILPFEYLGIDKLSDCLMSKLSKGENKRVAICITTMHNPSLLILDEPTSELDPNIRSLVWSNTFLRKGRSILFTTHMWEEAKLYADKIAFIYKGKLLLAPCSYNEIINSLPFTHKVLTQKETSRNLSSPNMIYENKSNKVFLIKSKEDSFLNKIRETTMNYTIQPIEIQDAYNFYKSKLI